ncbi:MAG: SpoIIE family protein phosphatase [Selenomonadaceae bacterium]|nr:SpoIIE family protein phosphatase [Selenomonadaceae bacterium]
MRKFDIRQKMRLLVLSGSVLGFVLFGVLGALGALRLWEVLSDWGVALGRSLTAQAENFTRGEEEERLIEATYLRAGLIDYEASSIQEDVEHLSFMLTELLRAPAEHAPRKLPNALYEDVPVGTPYVHFAPELAERGVDAGLEYEIEIASNIADDLDFMMKKYSDYPAIFIGSETGYTIRIEHKDYEGQLARLCQATQRHSYDSRMRSWYRLGRANEEPAFTEIYLSTVNTPCFSCAMPYYDANGLAGVVGLDVELRNIHKIVAENAFIEDEISFIIGADGEILSSTQKEGILSAIDINVDLRKNREEPALAAAVKKMTAGEEGFIELIFGGKEYYLAYAPIKTVGWSFGTLIEEDKASLPALRARERGDAQIARSKHAMAMDFLLAVVAAGGFFVLIFWLLTRGASKVAKRFSQPIMELADGVRDIASGNLERKLEVKTGDEIELLADSFNDMIVELKTQMKNIAEVTSERERTATELNVATNIQHSMLPNVFPAFPERNEFDIYATMNAAKEVGGDFYDFYLIDSDHLVVTIADVSGKSVPAALFMVISKTLLKNFAMMSRGSEDFAGTVSCANNRLCQSNEEMMFVTVFFGVLEISTGKFYYVNAGHNPPLVRHSKTGAFEYLTAVKKSPPLGVIEDLNFAQKSITLEAGDEIFLYTDGVTEAMNEAHELFGEKALQEALNGQPLEASPKETIEAVLAAVRAHAGAAEQSDDITMLTLKVRGA